MDSNASRNGAKIEDTMGSRTQTTTVSGPLSWEEARLTLRNVMEKYMETSLPFVESTTSNQPAEKWWQILFRWDVDFLAGAIVSVALLGLSVASLVTRNNGDIGMSAALNAAAGLTIYRAQVAASTLLLVGSFFCVFLVKRREYTFAHDSDVSKRKTLRKFLRANQDHDESLISSDERNSGEDSVGQQQLHHSGTSRTGIFPAYRRSGEREAVWYRIPTLLLVKGDYIALQVGDVAPARCKLMNADSQGSATCVIQGGETITASTFGDLWGLSPSLKFLPGKSTISSQSRELLELCNHMSLFVLEETPLEPFLRLPNGKIHVKVMLLYPTCYISSLLTHTFYSHSQAKAATSAPTVGCDP